MGQQDKGSQVASHSQYILGLRASEHTKLWMSCVEHRRGQAADTGTALLPSLPAPIVSATGQSKAEPSQGKQGGHTQIGFRGDIKTFL